MNETAEDILNRRSKEAGYKYFDDVVLVASLDFQKILINEAMKEIAYKSWEAGWDEAQSKAPPEYYLDTIVEKAESKETFMKELFNQK